MYIIKEKNIKSKVIYPFNHGVAHFNGSSIWGYYGNHTKL